MKTSAMLFLILSLSLASCARPVPPTAEAPMNRVAFHCNNGEDIEVRFFPQQGVAVLVRNGKTMELQQQPSGSGFRYSNGPNTIRGKGNQLSVEIGRMVPLQCEAS